MGLVPALGPGKTGGLLDNDVMAWTQSAPPNKKFLTQLRDFRRIIEPKAARWAAERGTEEDIALIEAAINRMEQKKGSVEDFVVADALFHRSILNAANNEFLRALEGVIFAALLSSIRLINNDPRDNADSLPFHRNVYTTIAARAADSAEEIMLSLLVDASNRINERIR